VAAGRRCGPGLLCWVLRALASWCAALQSPSTALGSGLPSWFLAHCAGSLAVVGSILSSRYSSDMASAVQGLPAPAAHAARDSLGAALHAAAQSGNPALAGAAKNAFVGGMTGAIWVAAAIAVVGAIVALIALPARERAELPMAAEGGALEAAAA
jgi:MFS transporter, DHA2 family, multidrug resistance protein